MAFVIVGSVGAAAGVGGALMSANAAGSAAKKQRQEAERQRATILQQGQDNQTRAMDLARATPQELAVLSRANTSALSSLDREEKALAAIDPAIMEASSQALKLLRGETAGSTQALANQRMSQRQQLVNSLRSQYGPAADTSSIGQRALQQFDLETNSMTQNANQQAFQTAFGAATADVGGRARMANQGLQQVGQGYSALQQRMLDTQINTGNGILGALSGTAQGLISSAGYGSVGQQIMGSGLSSFGNQALGIGLMGFGKNNGVDLLGDAGGKSVTGSYGDKRGMTLGQGE